MKALFRWITLRHLAQQARSLPTLAGVALGVAVFVSIRIAHHSALASFSDTVDAVAGRATLEVRAGSEGLDERLFPAVRAFPGVDAAAPRVEQYALARPGAPPAARPTAGERPYSETVLALGVDLLRERAFLRGEPAGSQRHTPRASAADSLSGGTLALLADPRGVAITGTLAARHHLGVGDTLTVLASGRPVPLTVRMVIASPELQNAFGGNVVIMDIASAQEIFARIGRLDRIGLLVDPARIESVMRGLQRVLPPAVAVDTPRGRTRQVENMVRSFQLNLGALSFIALFVAAFLILNAVSLSVLRRGREIGMLRALGVTRRQTLALFLGEGLLFGIVGSALGLLAGAWLARGALTSVSRTLTDLYLVSQARTLRLDPADIAVALVLGVATAIAASVAPALDAASQPPGVALRQPTGDGRRGALRAAVLGCGLLEGAGVIAAWAVGGHHPRGGFVAAFFTLAGFSLLAPAGTLGVAAALEGPAARLGGIEARLGARALRESAARTGVVVASLMVSVGMTVALSIMVGSFRRTVDTWVRQSLRGDLYVEPVGHRLTGSATTVPDALVEAVRAIPGVAAVDTYRGSRIVYRGAIAFAAGVDLAVQERYGRLQFLPDAPAHPIGRALAHDGVLVTESFARRHRVTAGDTLALETPAGQARLPVVAAFYDYTTDAGAILMDRALYQRLWRVRRVESFAVYARPGADVDAIRRAVLAAAGPDRLLSALPNATLRARVLTVFDQTFQITWALQAIAIVVAILGVFSTLTALILQRGHEIGVLRAIGAKRAQVRKMVLVEAGLLGIMGGVLGGICGLTLSVLLVHVINREFFGWTIRMSVDPWLFVRATLLVVAAALVAGLAPARLAASRVAAEAMRIE